MELIDEPLPGLFELKMVVHEDNRGSFCETFNEQTMASLGITDRFVQDNESRSAHAGTVRGLHLQAEPCPQGKLVRVLRGAILDVAVDLRPDSPTYLQHASVELIEDDYRAFWLPPGFAHGFCTLKPDTTVGYRVTGLYNREAERSIRWNDPALGIEWPTSEGDAVLSAKDADAPSLADYRAGH